MLINYDGEKDNYDYDKASVDFFINVGFVVTRRCNLRCIHCCETLGFEDYDLEKTKTIIDKLFDGGLRKICITGGEPLMRADIVDVLEYAHKKGFFVTFSTNGTMLNRDILIKIKPFINNIRFSLYGDENNHDRVTLIPGNYEKVKKSLQLAQELKIPSGVIMTVMKNNLPDLKEVVDICHKNNVSKIYLFSLMPTGRGKDIYPDEYVSPELISEEVSKISRDKKRCEIKVIDWRIEGQCVLAYESGEIVAQPSYTDPGNKKIVGNILQEDAASIWEKYPFKKSHIDYYLDYH